ncbi:MAG: hypothetical protein AB8G86_18055 [Saprospiraceae bacterium]
MKKKFDKNIHDKPDVQHSDQDYFREQDEEAANFLRLAELLRDNPKGCGELLSALYLEGTSYAELSVEKGVAEATLRQRRKRCLDKFRKVW